MIRKGLDYMEKIPVLLFRLEAPIQSWGEHSKWDYRDTSNFPTKSGIVGLLSCALGYQRDDARIDALCQDMKLAVRADRRGSIFTDYQTISAEIILAATRKKRTVGNTIVSRRNYLQDASFLVAVSLDDNRVFECNNALKNPCWQMYLGRKNCVPTVPVVGRISYDYSGILEALEKEPLIDRHDKKILIQYESDYGESKSDVYQSNKNRLFYRRKVETKVMEGV